MTRGRKHTGDRPLRRPAIEILEDRRPVAESIGTIASVAMLARAAHSSAPPHIAHLNMAALPSFSAAPRTAVKWTHGLTPTEHTALVPAAPQSSGTSPGKTGATDALFADRRDPQSSGPSAPTSSLLPTRTAPGAGASAGSSAAGLTSAPGGAGSAPDTGNAADDALAHAASMRIADPGHSPPSGARASVAPGGGSRTAGGGGTIFSDQPLSLASSTYSRGHKHGSDPLYVLDMNSSETIPANVMLNTFSTWGENLLAQVSGATVASYLWTTNAAPDLTGISGLTSADLQGTWVGFTGAARTDSVTVTETDSVGGHLSQTITFLVAGTDSPAYSASRPTSSGTWPGVLTPDQLASDEALAGAGPYASAGLADGSVETAFSMPAYNPNAAPVGLVYNSAAAAVDPVFVVHNLVASPGTIQAQLTLNGQSSQWINFNTTGLNPGDWTQIALQRNTTGQSVNLPTGRYAWSINAGGSISSNSVDVVNQSASPFGAGWSVANVEQLVPASGGVILVEPDGSSLWFAGGGGSFTSPPGDFSTLTSSGGTYTRTLPDGTKINFNGSGQQTSVVDTDGNTTSFGYTGGLLTGITDMNGQVTTLTYSGGRLASITDPANRTATLAYDGNGNLTAITDAASHLWQYTYNGNHRMASLIDPDSTASNGATQFQYTTNGLLAAVTFANTTITLQLLPMQGNGLANGTPTYVTAPLLATAD